MTAPGAKGHCGGLGRWAGLGKGKRHVDVPARSRGQEGLQPRRGSEVLGTRGPRLCLSRERSRPPSSGLGGRLRCRPRAPRVRLAHLAPTSLHR